MSEQSRIAQAIAYLNHAYESARWDVRLQWGRRSMKSAQIYCKATAMVTHDRILTDFPRVAASVRSQAIQQGKFTLCAVQQQEGVANICSSGGLGYRYVGVSNIQNLL